MTVRNGQKEEGFKIFPGALDRRKDNNFLEQNLALEDSFNG